ncbi:MAG: Mth938-like domain-containing protein [Anaerolineae bacterium]
MFHDADGPIEAYSFGKFIIQGNEHSEDEKGVVCGAGKDICLTREGISAWQERAGHTLKKKMLAPALAYMPDYLVIGCGAYERLECPRKLFEYLKEKGIEQVVALPTNEACSAYNLAYKQGTRVMLLAHGTC